MKRGVLKSFEEPTEDYRRELYKIYVSVLEADVSEIRKELLVDSLFVSEPWSWRVVGISLHALSLIKDNDFCWPGRGTLQRGHIVSRATTREVMLSRLLAFDEWWQVFWRNDKTEIVTRQENESGRKSLIILIDYTKGYFPPGKIGFSYRKTLEGEFCKELWSEHKNIFNKGENKNVDPS